MFLKTHRRHKHGKTHFYYSIAEDQRTTRGIVQQQVFYLGERNDSQREAWLGAISVFDEDAGSERQLALFPSTTPLPTHAASYGIHVRLDIMELHRPRHRGACWLATQLWSQLQRDPFWQSLLGASRKGTDWTKILQVHTTYRLLDPGSKWRIHRAPLMHFYVIGDHISSAPRLFCLAFMGSVIFGGFLRLGPAYL